MDRFRGLKNEQIMVVENDRTIRETVVAALNRMGCHIKGFESAEEGLAEIQKHHFGVIISDLRLPGMDGLAFFREMSTLGGHAVKILITGYADNEMVSAAREVNVDSVLEKPFTLEYLFTVLEEKIAGRGTSSGISEGAFASDGNAPTMSQRSEKTKGG